MEERAKRPGTLAHCLSFAGARRGLVVASLLLAALSAAASFVPFVAIYFVIADVVAAYPDLAALDAGALAGCGLLAIAGVAADVGLYLAALLCSHAAAFDTQYRLKLGIAEHLGRIPLGHIAPRQRAAVKDHGRGRERHRNVHRPFPARPRLHRRRACACRSS